VQRQSFATETGFSPGNFKRRNAPPLRSLSRATLCSSALLSRFVPLASGRRLSLLF